MITLQETVTLLERKGKFSNFKECSIWEMNKESISDMQEDLIRVSSEENLRANHLNL